ncbi:hypothetical protein [Bacillus sp. FJAT-29814]|uniref:hypothetical protein n=1 Tax=Bacillus sp. FJAT-29814 TaxID=1729688 RepID=UPI001C12AFEB|nr:hypothetical protein [Bacillus sp. FJAT-29814]
MCKAMVAKLDHHIYICDECDTIWLEGVQFKEENCQRFDAFIEANGLEPLWGELTDIDRYWTRE